MQVIVKADERLPQMKSTHAELVTILPLAKNTFF